MCKKMKAMRIKDYSEYYVTDTGAVYSRKTYNNPKGRIRRMHPCKNNKGYLMYCLSKKSKRHLFLAHRLVADAFILNPEELLDINHKNGIKTDNRVENLEWCSKKDNQIHAFRVLKNSKRVLRLKNGMVIDEFPNACAAAETLGLNFRNIYAVCNGDRKHCGGFEWRYK